MSHTEHVEAGFHQSLQRLADAIKSGDHRAILTEYLVVLAARGTVNHHLRNEAAPLLRQAQDL